MYELKFTDDEICTVINSLDFYSRIWLGQYDHILWDLRWTRNCDQLDKLNAVLCKKFGDMKTIILPGLRGYGLSGSYGIFCPERNVNAAIAYDMQQEFRYKRAMFLNPKGGITVDFRTPLPCNDDPCEFPKAECYDEDGKFCIKILIDESQCRIIADALHISMLENDCQIRKLFEYYTDDVAALAIADELTDLMTSIEIEHEVKNALINRILKRLGVLQIREYSVKS